MHGHRHHAVRLYCFRVTRADRLIDRQSDKQTNKQTDILITLRHTPPEAK